MGLALKRNPTYDPNIDLTLVVPLSPDEVFARMGSVVDANVVEVQERRADGFDFTIKNNFSVKLVWSTVEFTTRPEGTLVHTRMTKALTWGWFNIFMAPLGPQEIRGLGNYRAVTNAWRNVLTGT
ncbi:MAG: hypothetical protein KDB02_11065 [Acidimicrobiales bacterium]|nr:hypothetical protein [Acidimicrobiales bacterium]